MSRIFVNQPLIVQSTVTVTGDDCHYLTHVLRLHIGEKVFLFNGGALEFEATLQKIDSKKIVFSINQAWPVSKESPIEISIAQGIPKANKMDDLIPKLTELGALKLIPLMTERSQVKSISPHKLDRWKKIAKVSAQQTGRTRLMEIETPETLERLLEKHASFEKFFFYELELSEGFKPALKKCTAKQYLCIIGPEGGFTQPEVSLAKASHCHVVSLGQRILRTETVAPALTAIIQFEKGDLSL